MNKARSHYTFVLLLLAALAGVVWFVQSRIRHETLEAAPTEQTQSNNVAEKQVDIDVLQKGIEQSFAQEPPVLEQELSGNISATPKATAASESDAVNQSQTIIQKVPFTSQAPSAQWTDPVYQNGCEEASMLMAHAWKTGTPLPEKSRIEEDIQKLSQQAFKKFGQESYDTSAEDTATIFREFFPENQVSVQHNVSLDAMKRAIQEGEIVIVPVDGRKLHNPNFTQPGPEYHMLVVIGYDPTLRRFIANDPGTRKGASYPYPEQTLFDAMRDYPTGHHETVEKIDKAMIVVEK